MRKELYSIIAGLALAGCAGGSMGDLQWETDFDAAKAKADETGRPILANFTGSDWCGWCIRLKKEVFSTAEFAEYANGNLVLFEADFPRRTEQGDALKKQNEALAAHYKIRGFPTILLMDAKGEVLAQTGYQRGGPEEYIKHLKQLLE